MGRGARRVGREGGYRFLRSVEHEFQRERLAGDHVIQHLKIGKKVVVEWELKFIRSFLQL